MVILTILFIFKYLLYIKNIKLYSNIFYLNAKYIKKKLFSFFMLFKNDLFIVLFYEIRQVKKTIIIINQSIS